MMFLDHDGNEVTPWPCLERNEMLFLKAVERAGVLVAPRRFGDRMIVTVNASDKERIVNALRQERIRIDEELERRRNQ